MLSHSLGNLGKLFCFGGLGSVLHIPCILSGIRHRLSLLSCLLSLSCRFPCLICISLFRLLCCGFSTLSKLFSRFLQGRSHVLGLGIFSHTFFHSFLKSLPCIVKGVFNLDAGCLVCFLNHRQLFLSHCFGCLYQLIGLRYRRNRLRIFCQGLFERISQLLLLGLCLIQISFCALQVGLSNVAQFLLHQGILLEFPLKLLEGFCRRFVGQIHQQLEHGILFIKILLNTQLRFLFTQTRPGLFALTVFQILIMFSQLVQDFTQFILISDCRIE